MTDGTPASEMAVPVTCLTITIMLLVWR